MDEAKVVNFLLGGMLIMTIVMFSWTFIYLNNAETRIYSNPPAVSAFNA